MNKAERLLKMVEESSKIPANLQGPALLKSLGTDWSILSGGDANIVGDSNWNWNVGGSSGKKLTNKYPGGVALFSATSTAKKWNKLESKFVGFMDTQGYKLAHKEKLPKGRMLSIWMKK